MKSKSIICLMVLTCLLITPAFAQDQAAGEKNAEMPPMGAPEQMKELAFLEGTWDVNMEWLDEEDSTKWNKETAVCTYKKIIDGCGMQMSFVGSMMGMPFEGMMIQSYDRDRGEWQAAWIDIFGGKTSLYTGEKRGDTMSVSCEEIWQGQDYLSRMSTFNHTDKSFDWLMEASFDKGATWSTSGKAKYTKR